MTYPCPNCFFSWSVVPSAITRPLAMIMIRSLTHSAYSMLWVVIRTVCFSLNPSISFQVKSLTCASIPVVGSSRITSLGLPTRLKARDKRLLIPPEKVLTLPSIFFSRLTPSSCLVIFVLSMGSCFRQWKSSICYPAVNSSQRISNCGQTPITLRMLVISSSTLIWSISASPLVLASAPIMMLISVDFPAPFYPKRATI